MWTIYSAKGSSLPITFKAQSALAAINLIKPKKLVAIIITKTTKSVADTRVKYIKPTRSTGRTRYRQIMNHMPSRSYLWENRLLHPWSSCKMKLKFLRCLIIPTSSSATISTKAKPTVTSSLSTVLEDVWWLFWAKIIPLEIRNFSHKIRPSVLVNKLFKESSIYSWKASYTETLSQPIFSKEKILGKSLILVFPSSPSHKSSPSSMWEHLFTCPSNLSHRIYTPLKVTSFQ